jgi:hypothetical protein
MFAPLALRAQTTMFKLVQDGEFADFNLSTDPLTSFRLNVSRNFTTGSGTSASLSYTAFQFSPDFTSITITQIAGNIPASDFTGQTTRNLALTFSTSDLDPVTSFSQLCTVDLFTFTLTCGPVPAGTIQLTFSENDVQRTRVLSFNEDVTTGSITEHIHQRSDNSTANVTGTIFGVSVSGGGATVGINHMSTREFTRN